MKKVLSFCRTNKRSKSLQKPLGKLKPTGTTNVPIYGFAASRGQTKAVDGVVIIGCWPHVKVF